MLNGDIFSELFLSNLDEKITSAGYEKRKTAKQAILPDNILVFTFWRFTRKTEMQLNVLWIISALVASNWSQITVFILAKVLTSIAQF